VRNQSDAPPVPPRAKRLKQEAGNCLTIAVELIDEAMRLAKRARELTGAA
jgi:hypothetical protein